MAIITADLKFFAAQYATDDSYGGGPMSGTVVQDGVASNVFPVPGELDMELGRVQLRKVYAAVLSENADALVNASVNVFTPPADAGYGFALFVYGDAKTTRSEAAEALTRFPYGASPSGGSVSGSGPTYTFTGNYAPLQPGDRVLLGTPIATIVDPALPFMVTMVGTVETVVGDQVTLSVVSTSGSTAANMWRPVLKHPNAVHVVAGAEIAATVSSGASVISLMQTETRVIPELSAYPTTFDGLNALPLRGFGGLVPIFHAGTPVLVHDGTNSEVAVVARVNYLDSEIELQNTLTNGYAAGGVVSPLLQLGTMQAQVGIVFSQQTWTRTFSDALIGNPIGANFNRTANPITVINEGAETERWAIVFTSDTAFKLIGEQAGQIATGSTAANFSPLNPVTNQPYFTIPAAGWGTGWQVGNVLRLNTVGARAPFWAERTISPTPASPNDGAEIQFRGSY